MMKTEKIRAEKQLNKRSEKGDKMRFEIIRKVQKIN